MKEKEPISFLIYKHIVIVQTEKILKNVKMEIRITHISTTYYKYFGLFSIFL